MIPGVSRSGATIAGSLLLGTDKRSAAEFTFFLAMPTMGGAFVYDLYKNIDHVTTDDLLLVAVGFAAAFVVGAIVVKYLLDFVAKYGFAPFAYWRILIGTVGLIGLFVYTPPSSSSSAGEKPTLNAEQMLADAVGKPVETEINFQATAPQQQQSRQNNAETVITKQGRHPDWQIGIKADPLSR